MSANDYSEELFLDMGRADRIKAARPDSSVSADAIFLALRGITGVRKNKVIGPGEAPEWFHLALSVHKGRSLTVGGFMLVAGRLPATKAEKNAVGQWLRASGRQPYKHGGLSLFRI